MVATNDDYPPQSFQQEDGRWTGFDVDLAREIASRLGVSVEFLTPPWELILSGRWRGRWDIAVNSMAATKPRAERLDFAVAYYFTPVRAAVSISDLRFKSVNELQGVVVGVCNGCSYESYAKGKLEVIEEFTPIESIELSDVRWRVFPDEWAAAEALGPANSSEIDAVIASEPTLDAILKAEYPVRVLEGSLFNEPLAIATEKGEIALAIRLREIVAGIRADGVLESLSRKWFGTDYSRPIVPQ